MKLLNIFFYKIALLRYFLAIFIRFMENRNGLTMRKIREKNNKVLRHNTYQYNTRVHLEITEVVDLLLTTTLNAIHGHKNLHCIIIEN